MKLNKIVLMAVLASVIGFSGSLAAKAHKGGNLYQMLLSDRAVAKLDLSASQQAQIKAIADQQKGALTPFKEQAKEARKATKAIMQNDEFDEIAFRQALAKAQTTRTEMMVIKAKNKHQVMQILTQEQQEQVKHILKKRQNKMKQRRQMVD